MVAAAYLSTGESKAFSISPRAIWYFLRKRNFYRITVTNALLGNPSKYVGFRPARCVPYGTHLSPSSEHHHTTPQS